MKNPHDKNEYKTVDDVSTEQPPSEESPEDGVVVPTDGAGKNKKRRNKKSGAYYYVEGDEKTLAERSFIRSTLTVIALMLQIVILMLPQNGMAYVLDHSPSYAYVYAMFTIIVTGGVSIWLMVMNFTRYKIVKRIPVEYAPKKGFSRRAFFGAELYMAVNAVMFVFELSFICCEYNGAELACLFMSAAALAASVAARQVTHLTLKNAQLVKASDDTDQNKQ